MERKDHGPPSMLDELKIATYTSCNYLTTTHPPPPNFLLASLINMLLIVKYFNLQLFMGCLLYQTKKTSKKT